MYTPNEHAYRYFWSTLYWKDHFIFNVRACAHALVLLSTVPYNTKSGVYEIELGRAADGEGNNVIRETVLGNIVVRNEEAGLLHCDMYRTFWVAHTGGSIRVGKGGVVDEQQFMKWDTQTPITAMAVATTMGNHGSWQFFNTEGFYFLPSSQYVAILAWRFRPNRFSLVHKLWF